MTKEKILKNLVFENRKNVISDTQSYNDIIKGILHTHKIYQQDYDKIYSYFLADNYAAINQKIFNFLKNNVPYKAESSDEQTLRSPAAILQYNNSADCKSYALFTNGILDAIRRNENEDFDVIYRFASYDNTNKIEHVFAVQKIGEHEFWNDAVLPYFDCREKQPTFITDKKIKPMALVQVSGVKNNNINLQNLSILEQLRLQPSYVYVGKQNPYYATVNGGIFGGKMLEDFKKLLPRINVNFIYLFIGGTLNPSQCYGSLALINNERIVIQKRNLAAQCFWELHAQMDSVITAVDLMTLINDSLTQSLGMTPKTFWAKWFEGSNAIGNRNSDDDENNDLANIPLFGAALSFLTSGGLANFLGIELRFEPALDTFTPMLSDWQNSSLPIDKSLLNIGAIEQPTNVGAGAGASPLLPLGVGVLLYKLLF